MLLVGPAAPFLAQALRGLHDRYGLLDGVHGATLAPVRLTHLGVAGTALHGDEGRQRAAAGDPGVEASGFGADAGVGLHAVGDAGEATGARRLLVGVGTEDDVAGEADAGAGQALEGDHQGGDAALHVAHAAGVQAAVASRQRERVVGPLVARLDVHGVDVTVEEQAAPAARAAQPRSELRAPGEVEIIGNVTVAAAGGLGLPHVRLGAQRREPALEDPLQLLLVARRHAHGARRRVAGDELGRQAEELVAGVPHRGHDLLFKR